MTEFATLLASLATLGDGVSMWVGERQILQFVLVSALLCAMVWTTARRNAPTRRANALGVGLAVGCLPLVVLVVADAHWTVSRSPDGLNWHLGGVVGLPFWLILGWASGVAVMLIRIARDVFAVARKVHAAPVLWSGGAERGNTGRFALPILQYSKKLDTRAATVCAGDRACASTLFGNHVFLPRECANWTDEVLGAVLAHEMVHVARRDDRWMLMLRCVCAVYWFLPWVWILPKCYATAMEESCDDRAAELVGSEGDYLDGVATAAATASKANDSILLSERSLWPGLAEHPVVARVKRFLGARDQELEFQGVYWGLITSLAVSASATCFDLETAPEHQSSYRGNAALLYHDGVPGRSTNDDDAPRYVVPSVRSTYLSASTRPLAQHEPKAIYPGRALNNGVEGEVVVEYAIAADGSVTRARVVASSGEPAFDKSALRAARATRYNMFDVARLVQAVSRDPSNVAESVVLRKFAFRIAEHGY